jgi:serine/threonine-protein kinase
MTGTIVGTPNYMAPEQVQGLAVDGRADQFSLAVIAFELFTGEKPFMGEHLTTIVYKIVAEEPAPPHRLNPSLGLRIDAVVRKALSKNPEARFASCTEFLHALEAACDATRGWTLMTRGASASMPTALEQPAISPPAPIRHRDEEPERKRSSALPFVGALLVAGGLIGLIAWQANPTGQKKEAAPAAAKSEAPAPTPAKPKVDTQAAAAPAPPPPVETKPVQTEPPPSSPPQAAKVEPEPPPRPQRRSRPPAEPQPLQMTSSPAGAAATIDGDPALSCHTPCSLELAPGRHTVSLVLPGYQQERREIVITDSPQELGYITLRKLGGTLMLSSTPPGASITIDGHARTETTPARLDLAPGTYNVTVEKNGMRKTVRVEIRNGVTKYQPVQLGS